MIKAKSQTHKNLPSILKVIEYWYPIFNNDEWTKVLGLTWIDFGEPTCWACGNGWNGHYDISDWSTLKEAAKAWDRAPIHRCHIIPESLGGTSDPYNIFLMCGDCHKLCPDTKSRPNFFLWVKNRDYFKMQERCCISTFEDFGIVLNENLSEEFYNIIKSPKFFKFVIDNNFTTNHFGTTIMERFSTTISAALAYKNQLKSN